MEIFSNVLKKMETCFMYLNVLKTFKDFYRECICHMISYTHVATVRCKSELRQEYKYIKEV